MGFRIINDPVVAVNRREMDRDAGGTVEITEIACDLVFGVVQGQAGRAREDMSLVRKQQQRVCVDNEGCGTYVMGWYGNSGAAEGRISQCLTKGKKRQEGKERKRTFCSMQVDEPPLRQVHDLVFNPEACPLRRVHFDQTVDVFRCDSSVERLLVCDEDELDRRKFAVRSVLEKVLELVEAIGRGGAEVDELEVLERGRRVGENGGHRVLFGDAEDAELLVRREERVEPHVVRALGVALLTAKVRRRDVRLDTKLFEFSELGEDFGSFFGL
jgi:hypothetical protein